MAQIKTATRYFGCQDHLVKAASSAVESLRALHRGYKLALVLLAAWAPMLLARHLWLGIGVMSGCTATFLLATRGPVAKPSHPLPEPTEQGDDNV
jgi:hypothetical protein